MRAALLREFGKPLDIVDTPRPVPGEGEALVRVRAAGLCGTDLKILAGDLPTVSLPLIPGHEVSGELVNPVGNLAAGTRVAAYALFSCGICPSCRRGETTVCPKVIRLGFERNGGFAEYILVPIENLLPIGNDIRFDHAAVAMDAVLSPWRAIRTRGAVVAGNRVLIVGAGGLGLHAIQVALSLGASVAVLDPDSDHRIAAQELGVEIVVGPEDVRSVAAWAGVSGIDVALESSGTVSGFRSASDLVRPAGRVVCCGYRPGSDFAFDSMRLVMDEIKVLGSRGGTRQDTLDALTAVKAGHITPIVVGHGDLDEVNTMLDRIRYGKAAGRLVVEF